MTLGGFLVLLLVAAAAGALGQIMGGFTRGGCLIAVLVGFAGAWLGTWIAGRFGLPLLFVVRIQGEIFPVVWAVIGAAVLSAVLGLLTSRRA